MFTWHEYARLRTNVPLKDLVKEVRREFDEIGETDIEARDELVVDAKHYSGFGYDAKMTVMVEEGDPGDFDVKVRYELQPNAMCILCMLFWPILLIVWMNGNSTSNRMRSDINQVLERIEDRYGRRKRD
jgi:hypothetical protein